MAQANLLHDPVHGTLAGNRNSLRLLQQQCLIPPDPSVSIVAFVLADDFFRQPYCLYFVFMVIFTCHYEYLLILIILL